MDARVRGVGDTWSSRVGCGAWRTAPRPGHSASDGSAGARSAGTAARSIPCDAERADSPDRDSTEDRHAGARREWLDADSALRRVARVPALPRRDVRALVAHANGERHHRSKNKSERRARRFQQAESAREFQARRRGIHRTARNGSNATSCAAATTTILRMRNGTSSTAPGAPITCSPTPSGGCRITPQSQETTRPGPQVRCATGATPRTMTCKPSASPNGTSAANAATAPAASTSPDRARRPSSIRHGSTMWRQTTCACNATRRAARRRIPTTASTTTGRSASTSGWN